MMSADSREGRKRSASHGPGREAGGGGGKRGRRSGSSKRGRGRFVDAQEELPREGSSSLPPTQPPRATAAGHADSATRTTAASPSQPPRPRAQPPRAALSAASPPRGPPGQAAVRVEIAILPSPPGAKAGGKQGGKANAGGRPSPGGGWRQQRKQRNPHKQALLGEAIAPFRAVPGGQQQASTQQPSGRQQSSGKRRREEPGQAARPLAQPQGSQPKQQQMSQQPARQQQQQQQQQLVRQLQQMPQHQPAQRQQQQEPGRQHQQQQPGRQQHQQESVGRAPGGAAQQRQAAAPHPPQLLVRAPFFCDSAQPRAAGAAAAAGRAGGDARPGPGPGEAAPGGAQQPASRPAAQPAEPAPPAAAQQAQPAGAAGGAPAAREQAQRVRKRSGKNAPRRTLSAKQKEKAVLKALAQSAAADAAGAGAAAQPLPPQPAAGAAGGAAAAAAAGAGPQAAAAAAGGAEETSEACWTRNKGRAWVAEDIAALTRMARDRAFLLAALPQHPAEGPLDFELLSKHFGRYSKGGANVERVYRDVCLRVEKAARHEGRGGASYVDLVKAALRALPNRRGTVLQVQAVLKRDHASKLDKYKTGRGTERWKEAVAKVLRAGDAFEQVGKSGGGKIIWQLRDA